MYMKKQRLESELRAAMAAVRGTHVDPARRTDAESVFTELHEHASTEEYPHKETILSAVEQAWETFQTDNYRDTVQHLSRALIAVTRS